MGYVQALLGDALAQLRQQLLLIPYRFKLRFRTVDASLAQQAYDWMRDDIDEALTKASEIRAALSADDPWATWYRDKVDDKDEKARRTAKRHEKAGK